MTESEYLERDARAITVGRFMVECRTKAPDVYRRAFALHYANAGWRRDKEHCASELEAAISAHPWHVPFVISALECDDAAHFEKLICTLLTMHARCIARRLVDKMAGADGIA